MLTTVLSIRANIHQTAGENIFLAQEKQHRDYNQRHQVPHKIKEGQKAFLKNQRRMETKQKLINFYLNGLAHSKFVKHQRRTFVPYKQRWSTS